MLPGLAAVGGFVDAVADGEVGPLESFAAADVDDVGIRRREGESADGAGGLVVKDGFPDVAVVGRFPDAAIVGRHVEDVGLGGEACYADGASAAEGADHAPTQGG